MNSKCYLNGKLLPLDAAAVPVLDRGFLFGDGVYEVVPVYNGKLFCWARHHKRLVRSLESVGIVANVDGLLAQAQTLIAEENAVDAGLYFQITRGVAPRKHAFPNPPVQPTIFMMVSPRPEIPAAKVDNGVACKVVSDVRWLRADIKSISLLGAVLAAQEAAEAEVEEVIGIRDGIISEAAACNVFLAKDGKLLTPLADHRVLPGITREVVIELARENDIPVEERDVEESLLATADELMIASSSREVMPVTTLDGKQVGNGKPGKIFQTLHSAFRDFIASGRE